MTKPTFYEITKEKALQRVETPAAKITPDNSILYFNSPSYELFQGWARAKLYFDRLENAIILKRTVFTLDGSQTLSRTNRQIRMTITLPLRRLKLRILATQQWFKVCKRDPNTILILLEDQA